LFRGRWRSRIPSGALSIRAALQSDSDG
jgi:hypothetical protein